MAIFIQSPVIFKYSFHRPRPPPPRACDDNKKNACTQNSTRKFTIATMTAQSKSSCYYPNGVIKTRTVARSIAGFRRASDFVAAIDFGTTYCSLAYTLQRDSKDIFKLPLDGPHQRVPNAVLIEKVTNSVEAFGYRAQTLFAKTKQKERYLYFERMKMILYRRKVSTWYT